MELRLRDDDETGNAREKAGFLEWGDELLMQLPQGSPPDLAGYRVRTRHVRTPRALFREGTFELVGELGDPSAEVLLPGNELRSRINRSGDAALRQELGHLSRADSLAHLERSSE